MTAASANHGKQGLAWRRPARVLAQWACTAAALAFVAHKIDFPRFWAVIGGSRPEWILGAFLFLNLSIACNALRYRFYLSTIGLRLRPLPALALHYKGLFLNTVLPGGISGDGYKVYVLHRHSGRGLKKLVSVTLSGRVNGLAWLLLWALLLLPGVDLFRALVPHPAATAAVAAGAMLACYARLSQWIFGETLRTQAGAAVYSCLVQTLMVATAACLFHALHGGSGLAAYIVVFLASSVAAVLPLSVGGFGVRELVLLQGSHWLGLDADVGLALAALFSALYLASCIPGIGLLVFRPQRGRELSHA